MNRYESFECHTLEDGNLFFRGAPPEQLRVDADGFETHWRLHPEEYHIIKMHGRLVATPRATYAVGVGGEVALAIERLRARAHGQLECGSVVGAGGGPRAAWLASRFRFSTGCVR